MSLPRWLHNSIVQGGMILRTEAVRWTAIVRKDTASVLGGDGYYLPGDVNIEMRGRIFDGVKVDEGE